MASDKPSSLPSLSSSSSQGPPTPRPRYGFLRVNKCQVCGYMCDLNYGSLYMAHGKDPSCRIIHCGSKVCQAKALKGIKAHEEEYPYESDK